MLALSDLAAFLTSVVPSGFTVAVNRLPDSPDEVVAVNVMPGGRGLLVDGAFQEVMVQVRCRAATDAAAEQASLAVDLALVDSAPVVMGATYVTSVVPSAGPPAYFERDVENRTVYYCKYVLEVQR